MVLITLLQIMTAMDETYPICSVCKDTSFSHCTFIFLRFRGVHHAFAKILAEGGIRGLWAGWIPNIQRAALVNMGGNGNITGFQQVPVALRAISPLIRNVNICLFP